MFAGINQWFRRRRSFAISTLAAVASLGGLILVPIMSLVILNLSWRWAITGAGFAYLVGILPFTILFKNRPEDIGLRPDGDDRPVLIQTHSNTAANRNVEERDYTVKEALRTRTYWLLLTGAGLRQLATIGILVSLIPILQSKGVGLQMAANLTGAMFGINFVSRMTLGYFGDKWPKSWILGATLAIEALGFLCLFFGSWNDGKFFLLIIFIVFEGLGDGAGIIVWAALGEYYGREKFASLRGIITFSHSWVMIAMPVFAGWAYDHYGNFDLALMPAVAGAAAASVCFFLIKRPPRLSQI